jgi:hypothetical protein
MFINLLAIVPAVPKLKTDEVQDIHKSWTISRLSHVACCPFLTHLNHPLLHFIVGILFIFTKALVVRIW